MYICFDERKVVCLANKCLAMFRDLGFSGVELEALNLKKLIPTLNLEE